MGILLSAATAYIAVNFSLAVYRLATGFFYTPPKAPKQRSRLFTPLVSVVIPAWNEEIGIVRTVQSVIDSSYQQLEIIVVDDGSTDNTAAVVTKLSRKYPNCIKLISQPNGGKATALNTGIAEATGALILTLDADSYLERHSIARMVNALSDSRYSVAIGEVAVGNTKTWIGRAQYFEYLVGFHLKRSQHVFDSAYIFPGALTMFSASVLKQVGDFTDYSSTEDLDISIRIKMAGHKIVYVDSAVCITEGASTVKGLLNQRTRWRHGYLECLRNHKDFLVSPKKGWYLTLVDLPLQLFGVVEVLMFPLIFATLVFLVAVNTNLWSFLAAYSIIPLVLLMLNDLRYKRNQANLYVWVAPLLLTFVQVIEFIALLKSIYRTIRRQRTTWTVWQRTGAVN